MSLLTVLGLLTECTQSKFSAIDFVSNEKITGFTSSANATVNTGTAIADGGIRGNNAVIDVAGLAAGSVKEIDLININNTTPLQALEILTKLKEINAS